jgi:hypothetical protein
MCLGASHLNNAVCIYIRDVWGLWKTMEFMVMGGNQSPPGGKSRPRSPVLPREVGLRVLCVNFLFRKILY